MRIVSGKHRGRRLVNPANAPVRPTASRTREAIFNLLSHNRALQHLQHPGLQGAHVLDICCGTGALGVEALSRGAAHTTFIDSHPASLKTVEKNLDMLAERDNATLVRTDATGLPPATKQAEIILLDPPYQEAATLVPAILRSLHNQGWLSSHTAIVVETAADTNLQFSSPYQHVDKRRYGAATVWLLFARG